MKPNSYATADAAEQLVATTPWIDSQFEAICQHLLAVPIFQRGQFMISDAEVMKAAQGLSGTLNSCSDAGSDAGQPLVVTAKFAHHL